MKGSAIKSKNLRNKVRTLEWGPRDFGSRAASEDGSIMQIASKSPITIHKENTIKHAADLMARKGIRRLFITDPDSTLRGVLTAKDIVDFLGGGDRFKIIREKHSGNLIAASNESVRTIMSEKVIALSHRESIESALIKLGETGFGGIAVLENDKVVGVVSERDFARLLAKQFSGKKVKEFMNKKVIFGTTGMKLSDIAKVMVRNGYRRIPILKERNLAGVVTSMDIVTTFASKFSQDILDLRVEKIMKKPITTEPESLIMDAAELMRKNNIGGLPVVKNKRVIGILTERDMLRAIG